MPAWGVSQSDIARRIGRDPAYVSGRINFANNATPEVKRAVAENKINKTNALKIADKHDAAEQGELLAKATVAVRTVKANGEKPKAPRVSKEPENLKAAMAHNKQYQECKALMEEIGATMDTQIEKGEYLYEYYTSAKHDYSLRASKKRDECKLYSCLASSTLAQKIEKIRDAHK